MYNDMSCFPAQFKDQFKPENSSIICPSCKNRVNNADISEIWADYDCCDFALRHNRSLHTFYVHFNINKHNHWSYSLNTFELLSHKLDFKKVKMPNLDFYNWESACQKVSKFIEMIEFYE